MKEAKKSMQGQQLGACLPQNQGTVTVLAEVLNNKLKELGEVSRALEERLTAFVRAEPKEKKEIRGMTVSCQFGEYLQQQIIIVEGIMANERELLRTLDI